MFEVLQRMLPLKNGRRTAIKIDTATWQAIDWLAEQSGQTWQQWCASVIDAMPEGENMTASLRSAAMDCILTETVMGSRATIDSIADKHPLLCDSAMMSDAELSEHMRKCHIDGSEDMGGFILHAGQDEFGRACLWIENQLKGWPSVVIPMSAVLRLSQD
ncbi:MAG: ribbon-helix-helix domain-containing protein [Gammaproteobacteria bacterium]|nr:ribbon-helix-helix domain-containing protein [Gammaproteobacteria bacterium]